jgi:hypothetical protein
VLPYPAPRCVARYLHSFGPMLWRESWTFGAPLRDLLGIASDAISSEINSRVTSFSRSASFVLDLVSGKLPDDVAPWTKPAAYPGGMNAWYCPGAFDLTSSTWQDCSGNRNTAVLSGSGLAESRSAGHGMTSEVLALSGTTSSQIAFGAVIPSAFTVCSVTRYTGGTKGRILSGGGANWLHGHHNGKAGVAYYEGWKTAVQNNVSPNTDWVVMCGSNAGSQLKLVNGADVGTAAGGRGGVSLFVNAGDHSREKSDFAIAEVVVWPRGLTDVEMRGVSEHMINRLG